MEHGNETSASIKVVEILSQSIDYCILKKDLTHGDGQNRVSCEQL
jgi:hypothetical protein